VSIPVALLTVGAWALIGFAIGVAIGGVKLFGILIVGPLAAVAAALVARKLTQRFEKDEHRQRVVLGATVAVGLLLVAGGSMVGSSDSAAINPGDMFFEVRLPPGARPPTKNDLRAELRVADSPTRDASFYDGLWLGRDGNRVVLKGHVEMLRKSPDRIFAFRVANGPTHLFVLRLPEKPTHSDDFGPWYASDLMQDGPDGAARKPNGSEAYDIRYRVRVN